MEQINRLQEGKYSDHSSLLVSCRFTEQKKRSFKEGKAESGLLKWGRCSSLSCSLSSIFAFCLLVGGEVSALVALRIEAQVCFKQV
jgi:hypothetical protein